MRELVLTSKFKRAYRKFAKNDISRRRNIEAILLKMSEDVYTNSLATHKLSGELMGLWACSCGYDCRIVFSIEIDVHNGQEVILLLDIGTHDEVY